MCLKSRATDVDVLSFVHEVHSVHYVHLLDAGQMDLVDVMDEVDCDVHRSQAAVGLVPEAPDDSPGKAARNSSLLARMRYSSCDS